MDKYSKIQDLIDLQKKKKEILLQVFFDVLKFQPKLEVAFGKIGEDVIRVKIIDKSSVKFIVLQNKEKLVNGFNTKFKDLLILG